MFSKKKKKDNNEKKWHKIVEKGQKYYLEEILNFNDFIIK